MKKAVPIIVAIALLGAVVMWNGGSKSDANSNSTPVSDVRSASTTTSPATQAQSTTSTNAKYKDGTYTGATASNVYEDATVTVTIKNGQIAGTTLQVSNMGERESAQIVSRAKSRLNQQAVNAQSAHLDGVSGATEISQSFIESLGSALTQATNS